MEGVGGGDREVCLVNRRWEAHSQHIQIKCSTQRE